MDVLDELLDDDAVVEDDKPQTSLNFPREVAESDPIEAPEIPSWWDLVVR